MRTAFKTLKINLTAIFLVGGFFMVSFLFAHQAQAAGSTLRGLAYWGTNGYVSFNCLDDINGDRLDVLNNLSGSGLYVPPDDKFHFFAPACMFNTHAVTLDANNNFGGQAWNHSQDFISFSGTNTPPDNYAATSGSHCSHTCNSSNSCYACYNEAEQKVYGWARVDKTGDWIRLDSALNPSVKLQTCNSATIVLPGFDIQPGDFVGNASSVLGDLSFNCESESGGSTCATTAYKVYISNLSIGSLTAPHWSYGDACSNGNALAADLNWCVKSGAQAAYEIVINKTDFGATPSTSTAFCWSGIASSSIASDFYPQLSCGTKMQYGTNYYWWIRLYDTNGSSTEWYQYYGNTNADSDGNVDNNPKTFTTYKHEFPTPYFTWSPTDILVGTTTSFVSSSTYFTNSSPNVPQVCNNVFCRYLWTTDDNLAIIASSTYANTGIIFNSATNTKVTLTVTDNENYFCTRAVITSINYDLPVWREIKAQ